MRTYILGLRDDLVLPSAVSIECFDDALLQRNIDTTHRKGKYMYWKLSNSKKSEFSYAILHFGETSVKQF